jgi:mono/diheme cytochrome c family protein
VRRTVIVTMISALLMSGVAAHAGEETKADAKALFEKKCIQCHTLDRPRSKRKTEKEWRETVMRMKNVNGAPITDDEAKIIIEYLAETYGK